MPQGAAGDQNPAVQSGPGPGSAVGGEAPPLARAAVLGVAAVQAVLLLGTAGRYGYHRDELYFLACGRHPAWGYPDQPPLTPFLARLCDALAPGSLVVFRLPAILAAVAVTVLAAALAREFGGARPAQVLAAVAVGGGTVTLGLGHMLSTSSVDLLVWVALTWLVTHILRTGQDRWWVVAGVVAGVGLLNKQLPVVLVAGLGTGLLVTGQGRTVLRSRWLVLGLCVAAAAWAPVLDWQARHGWPQFTLAREIRAEYGTPGQRVGFLVLQVLLFSLAATVLWVIGLIRLLRDERWRSFRALGWAWLVIQAVFLVTAGQGYYPAGAYPALIAAGAVVVLRRDDVVLPGDAGREVAGDAVGPRPGTGGRVGRGPRAGAAWLVGTVAASLVSMPAVLPVLPAHTLNGSPWTGLAEPLRESVGWPGIAAQIAAVYRSIPPARRAEAVVFTANYGEAGAVDRYGPALGLPRAYSGINGYGYWGPPRRDGGPVVLVWEGGAPEAPFVGCEDRGRLRTGVHDEESDYASLYLCDGLAPGGWARAWPELQHLSS